MSAEKAKVSASTAGVACGSAIVSLLFDFAFRGAIQFFTCWVLAYVWPAVELAPFEQGGSATAFKKLGEESFLEGFGFCPWMRCGT